MRKGERRCTLRHMLQHTLQHTARPRTSYAHGARCNTLQDTAPRCITLQHTAPHCTTLHHTAPHCNTLQHTSTHCNTLPHMQASVRIRFWNWSDVSRINKSCLTYQWVMSHISMSHVSHINESCLTYSSVSDQCIMHTILIGIGAHGEIYHGMRIRESERARVSVCLSMWVCESNLFV